MLFNVILVDLDVPAFRYLRERLWKEGDREILVSSIEMKEYEISYNLLA
jgi:hypothetical protein